MMQRNTKAANTSGTFRATMRAAIFAAAAFTAPHAAWADNVVTLRTHIEATGPAVTLGDFFDGAGPASGHAVAPAPAPGRSAQFSALFVSAAASAAGLEWQMPEGLEKISVTRRSDGAVRVAPARAASATAIRATSAGPANAKADLAVRKGDVVTLVYVAPGIQLTTRARALEDAALGAPVRLMNLQSNKPVDGFVTGPGAATANAGRPAG
jgi:flagella basal body P-ring formation protein FlgA